jgi:hypothetical protein
VNEILQLQRRIEHAARRSDYWNTGSQLTALVPLNFTSKQTSFSGFICVIVAHKTLCACDTKSLWTLFRAIVLFGTIRIAERGVFNFHADLCCLVAWMFPSFLAIWSCRRTCHVYLSLQWSWSLPGCRFHLALRLWSTSCIASSLVASLITLWSHFEMPCQCFT